MNVSEIQNALNTHGFPCGPADGVAGPRTIDSIKRFQGAYCGPGGWLDIDGVAGPKTIDALQWTVDNNALVSFFSIDELKCHCGCNCAWVKRELLSELFKLRQAVGPIRLASAFRCAAHNATIRGAAPNSQHVQGAAADPENVSIAQVEQHTNFTGIGTPDGVRATHVDVRPGPRIHFPDASNG